MHLNSSTAGRRFARWPDRWTALRSALAAGAGTTAGLIGAATPAWAQDSYSDPAGSGPIVSALAWLQGTLLGTVATVELCDAHCHALVEIVRRELGLADEETVGFVA